MVWQARLKRVIYANNARFCDFKSAEVAGLEAKLSLYKLYV